MRLYLLKHMSFIPDSLMVRIQYYIKTGRQLNLKNPKRFTEKLQWYKLYYRNPLMPMCADKYEVRKFVESKGLGRILNELYGVYENPDEIDFDKLPNQFVMKDTLGGGGNDIIICRDKKKLDLPETIKKMSLWTKTIYAKHSGREWIYEKRKHYIIIEKLLISPKENDLRDYKFFCFNGEPYCLYVMQNYVFDHTQGELSFFTKEFNLMSVHRKDFNPILRQPAIPENYKEMLEMARILSSGFPHVRVDLYNIEGKIVFGEMTFFTGSGYIQFEPDEFDYKLGSKFKLN